MYDIKNLNIWKQNSNDPFRGTEKVFITDVLKRQGKYMGNTFQEIFDEMTTLVPNDKFLELQNSKRVMFRFPIYVNEKLNSTSIDVLELSVRSSNCLHRAGFNTIGQLVESIESFEDLKKIRNCGTKSVTEIMEQLFCYQYNQLDASKKKKYINKVLKYNMEY